MASRDPASVASVPRIAAYVGMKKIGVFWPMSMKYDAPARIKNFGFLKNPEDQKLVACGGIRDLTVTLANASSGSVEKPMILSVHPYPRDVFVVQHLGRGDGARRRLRSTTRIRRARGRWRVSCRTSVCDYRDDGNL